MVRRIAPMPPQQHQAEEKVKGVPETIKANSLVHKVPDNIAKVNTDTMENTFTYCGGEFDAGDDNNTEKLAKQLVNSATIDSDRISPSIDSIISDESRIDYTDEVKRKYFNISEKVEKDQNHRFPFSRKGYHNIDEGIPSKVFANDSSLCGSNQSSLSPGGNGLCVRRSNNNETTNRIQGSTCRTHTNFGLPNTPPLTLHQNEGIPPLTVFSQACPDTRESLNNNNNHSSLSFNNGAGISPSAGMTMFASEQNTSASPAATSTPNLNSISGYNPQVGSIGSAASSKGSASTAIMIKQPLLYSAIGSLENVNCNSLTNLNKRFLTPSKEFCKPEGIFAATEQSKSIPPARQYQSKHQARLELHTNSTSQAPESVRSDREMFQQKDISVKSIRASDLNCVPNEKTSESAKKKKNSENKKPEDKKSPILTSLSDRKSYTREMPNRQDATAGDLLTNNNEKIIDASTETTNTIRDGKNKSYRKAKSSKKVSYDATAKKKRSQSKPVEMFRPSSDAYTPRIERKTIKYKTAESRPFVQHMSSPMGTLQRPNFRDALRRVAMIIHQHIVKIESRFEKQRRQLNHGDTRKKGATVDGLFHTSMGDMFNEDSYRTPTYKCHMARIPMARPGMVYGLRKIKVVYTIPSETEIYGFAHQLFKSVQLSSECSIVCLIYVERLMEVAKVPLLACTWRPIFMCGLLLASKVWQDLSSWNIEFSSVYPQFSLEAINKLELNFLRNVKWDLYISSSLYAKYYFALRSLVEKNDFRQRYNRMVGGVGNVAQAEALKVQKRTERVKEEALLQLSRSM